MSQSNSAFPEIKKICALGAGTMGIGTAAEYAKEGYRVALYVREDEKMSEADNAAKRQKAADSIVAVLKDLAAYELLGAESIPDIMARITVTSDLCQAASEADFVMESIREEVADKQDIFLKLDKICPPHTMFATNTSALDPTEIASVLPENRRHNFLVMHGFNPPHLMPLVEVAPGKDTSRATMSAAVHLLENIGKRPVRLHKATPGFIVNYIQAAIIWTAMKLYVEHGVEPKEIDAHFRANLGQNYQQLGPLEMAGFENSDLSHVEAKIELAKLKEGAVTGTIADHIQSAALTAALTIVADGTASAREVEYAFIHSLGRRYIETGPLESADMGGLDIFQSIFRTVGYLKEETAVSRWLDDRVKSKETGTKCDSKKGIYAWNPEMIAEIGGRRKGTLVAFLKEDMARRPVAGSSRNFAPHTFRS